MPSEHTYPLQIHSADNETRTVHRSHPASCSGTLQFELYRYLALICLGDGTLSGFFSMRLLAS
jgi:hypothetical protein